MKIESLLAMLLIGLSSAATAQLAPSTDVVPDQLAAEAAAEGSVRAIVRLDVGFRPEGVLASTAAVVDQRQEIDAAQEQVLSTLEGEPFALVREYEASPFLVVQVGAAGLNAIEVRDANGAVLQVTEDRLLAPSLAQSTGVVETNSAYTAGADGAGTVVAVLDTGVDNTHPFLAGKVVEEACFSANRNCPDGSSSQAGFGAGAQCTYAPSGCEHGTHVAGIAVGNGPDFSGVARGANLMSVQIFSRFTGRSCAGTGEDPCALAYTSDIIAGLERVYLLRGNHNFAAVNLSLGGGQYAANCDADPTKSAIDNLRSVGIATVVAAGNEGFTNALSSPACVSTAVSVGSTDDGSSGTTVDQVSGFSNSAPFLSLLAPGRAINSSLPGGVFSNLAGTSMAAPHVAGAWAIKKQQNPTASVTAILADLQNTGAPVSDSRNGITKPRLAFAATAPASAVCQRAAATVVGTTGNDTINGTSGADVITGLGGNDVINGLGGNDRLCGALGDDVLEGGAGNDAVEGGAGLDIARFSTSTTAVAASLAAGTATGQGSDTLITIENLAGTGLADTLTGDDFVNALSGAGGADRLNGNASNDNISGGSGNDAINGGLGADTCNGGAGSRDTQSACESVSGVP